MGILDRISEAKGKFRQRQLEVGAREQEKNERTLVLQRAERSILEKQLVVRNEVESNAKRIKELRGPSKLDKVAQGLKKFNAYAKKNIERNQKSGAGFQFGGNTTPSKNNIFIGGTVGNNSDKSMFSNNNSEPKKKKSSRSGKTIVIRL